jgi:hypothetical protein
MNEERNFIIPLTETQVLYLRTCLERTNFSGRELNQINSLQSAIQKGIEQSMVAYEETDNRTNSEVTEHISE